MLNKKYEAYFNSINLPKLTINELNLLLAILSKTQGKGPERIVFTYDQIKDIIFFKNVPDEKIKKLLKNISPKLEQVNGEILENGLIIHYSIFQTIIHDSDEHIFALQINEDILFIIKNLLKTFTLFELKEFLQLPNKTSKQLYNLLKPAREIGFLEIKVNTLNEALQIADWYSYKYILDEILPHLIAELQPMYKNLRVETKVEKRRGMPVVAYIFRFKPETRKQIHHTE